MSWPTKPIGELCDLINGRAFKPSDWGTRGLPIIRIQNLNDPEKPFNYYDGEHSENHLVRDNEILLSWSGTPGTSFGCFRWRRGRGLLNQHIFKVSVDESLMDGEFFIHAVNSRLEEMIGQAHGGVGLRHITKSKLNAIHLPVPSLKEQRGVVARIKECMERVDEIERLRTASSQEQNALSASLIEAEIHDKSGAHEVPIGDLVTRMRNGRSISEDSSGLANGSVLSLTAVRSIELGVNFQKPIVLPDSVQEQFSIEADDVFVSRANTIELVGLSSIAAAAPAGRVIYPDLLIKLVAKRDRVLPRYLTYALRSSSARKQIKDRALGSSQTMVKISGERLREVTIPIPIIDQQQEIVDRLDSAHALVEKLFSTSADAPVHMLRESILRKAFASELQ